MDAISLRCKTCKHPMRFSAEKAGKRAKCPKCDAIVLIQADEEPKAEAPPVVVAAAAPDDDDEYSGKGSYGVFVDPEIERRQKEIAAEEEARAKRKDKKKLPKVTRKVKAIPDAEDWDKVRIGLLFVFIGTCVWFVSHLLHGSYVLIGTVEFPEYGSMVAGNLEFRGDEEFPDRGRTWDIDELQVHLGMIAGRDFIGYARTAFTLTAVLYLIQSLLMMGGYLFCLPAPRRYGSFGQVLTMLGLGVLNLIFMSVFKILPALGAHGYILIPYVTPEIAMTEYNMERIMPIHVMWSAAPFWENLLNVFLRFVQMLEPTLVCVFIWSAGLAIKDDTVAQGGKGLAKLSLGTLFILVSFHLLSLCGASSVLVLVIRVFYVIWFCFLLLFILQFAMLLLKTRAVLYEKINPKNELED